MNKGAYNMSMKSWDYLEEIEQAIGKDELLLNLLKYMSEQDRYDALAYISRMFDLDIMDDTDDTQD